MFLYGMFLDKLVIISGFIFSLWGFLAALYVMLIKSNIDTDELHTSIWIFLYVG